MCTAEPHTIGNHLPTAAAIRGGWSPVGDFDFSASTSVLWCTVALLAEPSLLVNLVPLMIAFAVLHGLLLAAARVNAAEPVRRNPP